MSRGPVKIGQGKDVLVFAGIFGQLTGAGQVGVARISNAEIGLAGIDAADVFHRTGRSHVGDFDIRDSFGKAGGHAVGEVLEGAAVRAAGESQAGFLGVADVRRQGHGCHQQR